MKLSWGTLYWGLVNDENDLPDWQQQKNGASDGKVITAAVDSTCTHWGALTV